MTDGWRFDRCQRMDLASEDETVERGWTLCEKRLPDPTDLLTINNRWRLSAFGRPAPYGESTAM
jgi:hypothetical protein